MTSADDVQRAITACWNGAAMSYEQQPGHGLLSEAEREAWLAFLEGLLPLPPADVLDIGTGAGFLAHRAHELGHRVTAIDLADEMLDVARGLGGTAGPRFLHDDAIEPDFAPASFDVVMSRHVLWNLHDPKRALRNWHGILRAGGTLVVIDVILSEEDGERATSGAMDIARLPAARFDHRDEAARLVGSVGFESVTFAETARLDEADGALDWTRARYALTARRP